MFMSGYMMLLMALTGYAAWMLYNGGNLIAWGGALLTAAPIMMFFMRAMIFKNMSRTSQHLPLINMMGLMGVGLSGWVLYSIAANGLAVSLSLASWVAFLLYSFWYSSYGGRESGAQLKVGNALPDFSVINTDGKGVSSKTLTDKPAIIIFYRGNWCPFCMAQLKELAESYKEISKLGVRIAMISPQPHENTVQIAKKYRIDLSFEFLTDEDNAAAKQLGIDQPNGLPMGLQVLGYDSDTVMPTVIITDKNGRIIWTHETDNYRIRPEPALYLEVLRENGIVPAVA